MPQELTKNGFAVFQAKKSDGAPGTVILMPYSERGGVLAHDAVELGETPEDVGATLTLILSQGTSE